MRRMRKIFGSVLMTAILISAALQGSAFALTAEEQPVAASVWSFHELINSNTTQLDPVGYINMSVVNSSWGGVNMVSDAEKGTVMESGCFASSRWGDGSSPFYFDIQSSSLSISMDVKLNDNRSTYSVLMSDMITTPGNSSDVTHSWCIWVKPDGTVEFMNYFDNTYSRYWNLGTMPSNVWVNFTVVFDANAKTIVTYLDGVEEKLIYVPREESVMAAVTDASTTTPAGQAPYWTGFAFGRNGKGDQGNIDGTYCNVSYYASALTAEQVGFLNGISDLSVSLNSSVYQGSWESNPALPAGCTADESCVIFFGTLSIPDASDIVSYGMIVETAEESKRFECDTVNYPYNSNGQFGIALYKIPAGNYTVKAFVILSDDTEILSEGVNFSVE